MSEQRVRLMRIDRGLLASVLDFPEGTVIEAAETDMLGLNQDIVLRITSPDFPPAHDGRSIPEVMADYVRDDSGKVSFQQWHDSWKSEEDLAAQDRLNREQVAVALERMKIRMRDK